MSRGGRDIQRVELDEATASGRSGGSDADELDRAGDRGDAFVEQRLRPAPARRAMKSGGKRSADAALDRVEKSRPVRPT